jgi:hypothetical protein
MTQKLFKAVLVLLLFSTIVHAQKISSTKIPAEVKASFGKAHPQIGKVSWELENGSYEAGFSKNGVNTSELYSKTGALMETETEIKIASLPAGILAYVKGHYKGVSIKEAAKITSSKGVLTYGAAIKGKDLIFDDKGHFIKEIKD